MSDEPAENVTAALLNQQTGLRISSIPEESKYHMLVLSVRHHILGQYNYSDIIFIQQYIIMAVIIRLEWTDCTYLTECVSNDIATILYSIDLVQAQHLSSIDRFIEKQKNPFTKQAINRAVMGVLCEIVVYITDSLVLYRLVLVVVDKGLRRLGTLQFGLGDGWRGAPLGKL